MADATGPTPVVLRYNQVRQKSSHNSYDRHEAILDQLIYHRVRSLEFDIHVRKSGDRVPGDWFVYHNTFERQTSCHMLSDCLDELRAFDAALPGHEVTTVWIDLKDPFEDGNRPDDLDALLDGLLPAGEVFTPAELLAACPGAADLKAAVTSGCAWPDLETLRGQFVFVLTGGDVADPGTRLSEYLDDSGDPAARTAFVAPDFSDAGSLAGDANVVFLNMPALDVALADEVFTAGYVSRVWGVNSESVWNQAVAFRVHHVATDKINYHEDPWAVTHDGDSWPFQCLQSCDHEGGEPDKLLSIEVTSGDIWDAQDSFWWLYTDEDLDRPVSWSTFVSTANSHVDQWAKGCLMARASTDADAAYFAVCRPADNQRMRVQIRSSRGASTTAMEADITAADTVDPESVTFMRLDIDSDMRCATGLGSQNGSDWVAIAQQCFAEPLALQGVAASSHDSGSVQFLFGQLQRSGDVTEPFSASDFGASAAIGAGASGSATEL